jgi:phage terminase large subunit
VFTRTTAYNKILNLTKRIRVLQGGTSAGKTVAVLLYLITIAQTQKLSISIVSESLPHLKRGAIRDFLNIMREHNYYKDDEWNRTNFTYQFDNGSYIEFFNADDPQKLRGARRDILFVNEANNISYNAFEQMEVRTRLFVILDYNPVAEFWVHEELIPVHDHDFLILTYKDNEALDDNIIRAIESRKHNANWWRVYGLGQVGYNEGQVFKDWKDIEFIPEEARLVRYGLDFGYTNDPSAIVAVYKWNDAFILDEVIYNTGQSNKELANHIRHHADLTFCDMENQYQNVVETLTIADSAEPKSIDDMKRFGLRITGALKGPGSINYGIETVQNCDIYVTKRSLNIWKEQRNYLWKVDRDGKSLNVPEDQFNHSMDAIRYAIGDLKKRRSVKVFSKKPSGF